MDYINKKKNLLDLRSKVLISYRKLVNDTINYMEMFDSLSREIVSMEEMLDFSRLNNADLDSLKVKVIAETLKDVEAYTELQEFMNDKNRGLR